MPSLIPPQPSTSFPSLAVRLSRRGPGIFSHISDVTGRKIVESLYRIVPSKHPTPNFDSWWFFRVLRATAHHAKFSRSESEGRCAELTQLRLHFGHHDIKGLHTPIRGLFHSVLPLQHESHVLSVVKAWVGKIPRVPYVSMEMIAHGTMSCDCG